MMTTIYKVIDINIFTHMRKINNNVFQNVLDFRKRIIILDFTKKKRIFFILSEFGYFINKDFNA